MRGLRVGLVEQYDLAFGTSSRSTRLLHGGLRYLSQGHLGLVYQSSHEKKIVHRIAPHISKPLAIIFPTYRRTQWPFWKLRIGVKIYDLLCGGRNLGPSYGLSAGEVLARVPGLNPYDLDRRSEVLRLAKQRRPAGHRYASLRRRSWSNSCQLSAIGNGHCRQKRLGMPAPRHFRPTERYRVFARTVVNACGPWAATLPNSSVRLRLTKGVHLVIDRQRLPLPDAVMVTEGKRTLFVIPWGERSILGSTDTDYDGPLDDVRTDPDDVRYVLDVINQYFPEAKLMPSDISKHLGRPAPAYRHPATAGRPIFPGPIKSACPNPAGSTWPAEN